MNRPYILMTFDTARKHRRSQRLPFHDYSASGAYFVTVCTKDRVCLFGDVKEEAMHLNESGRIVEMAWNTLSEHYPNIVLDTIVVMPNHVHGLIIVRDVHMDTADVEMIDDTSLRATRRRMLLPRIMGRFKMTSARRINDLRQSQGFPIWQRGYHEHVVRDQGTLKRIRQYITNNPAQWASDAENPDRIESV